MSVESIPLNADVEALLTGAGLPVSDVHEVHGLNLFGVRLNESLIGVVGVEVHGAAGLLRSLAVAEAHRGGGYGQALVSHAEAWASQRGVKALYLLTTSAAAFFARMGYEAIPRAEAPEVIAATSQFSALCPSSATFMRKVLTAHHGGY